MKYFTNGTYGKIFKSEDTKYVKKVVHCLSYGTIQEIYFLLNYCDKTRKKNIEHTFLPSFYKLECTDKLIVLHISYCGHTLEHLKSILNYKERQKILPDLLEQFVLILKWLKSKNIIHMDITLANVCYGTDETCPKIVLIDFVFSVCQSDKKIQHIGSYAFADPNYYNSVVHTSKYDVFSVGMLLMSFLIKQYIDKNIFTDKYILYYFSFENLLKLENIRASLYTIRTMIFVDAEKRPDSDEIQLYKILPNEKLNELYDEINKNKKYVDENCSDVINNDEIIEHLEVYDVNIDINNYSINKIDMIFDEKTATKYNLKIKDAITSAKLIYDIKIFKYLYATGYKYLYDSEINNTKNCVIV
jgi:hypothetical protein